MTSETLEKSLKKEKSSGSSQVMSSEIPPTSVYTTTTAPTPTSDYTPPGVMPSSYCGVDGAGTLLDGGACLYWGMHHFLNRCESEANKFTH